MPKRKVVASVSFVLPSDEVKKSQLRELIKDSLGSLGASVRVNFEQWGGETIIKKAPAKTKKRVLQAGKGKKGKGKGKPNKPAKKVAVTRFPKDMVNGVGGIAIETEL